MYKIAGLRTWNLHADDLEEMVRFYQDVLGGTDLVRQTNEGIAVARLRVGETGIGLFDASSRHHPRVPHHTFNFDGPRDPDVMVEELKAKGVKIDSIRPHGDGPGFSVHIFDPCGNRIELSTDPPSS